MQNYQSLLGYASDMRKDRKYPRTSFDNEKMSTFLKPLYEVQRLSQCHRLCLSVVLALFKPCDWSTRFMKVILLVLSLVRILHLMRPGWHQDSCVYSVQVYCCTKHLYGRITVPSNVRAPLVSMKTL